ncbi:hypothetical protein [Streptomyces sp. NBC_01320]|uniref:hypothetical protein n=1 Tax=Streptomyces sp. NBC_01320 TaxID=2903824 RepID=UPI002E150BE2|nr:hypothetical protein OG395_23710 [Streptomyces sp. NBC_01320]
MTTAAVRSVAGPRPVRGPVGRRTLQVVLFLGGLLALGVLFGAEAHAEQVPVPSHAVVEKAVARGAGAMADRTAVPDAEPAADATEASAAVATRVPAARPEGSRAAERLAVPAAVTTATAPPAPSSATAGPDAVPGLRPVAGAARATVQEPGRPVVRLVGKAVGTALGQAAGLLPDPLALPTGLLPPHPPIGPPARGSAEGSAPRPAAPAPRPAGAYTVAADPGRGFAALLSGVTAKGTERRGAVPQYRPAPGQVPLDPCGGFGGPATAVTYVPRGGDQHAVPFAGGASFGLVRGAGLPATAAPMRDRSGEIVEFPG